jgi:hypothetical protein
MFVELLLFELTPFFTTLLVDDMEGLFTDKDDKSA